MISPADHESSFLDQAGHSVARVFDKYGDAEIESLAPVEREALQTARALRARLQALVDKNCCQRCWLPNALCVCNRCSSLEGGSSKPIPEVKRLFLLMHYKEIGLKVDTAKLIMSAFPETCRLV